MSKPLDINSPNFTEEFMKAVNSAAEVIAEKDVKVERERADKWMELGKRYDDIRDWLRSCEDTPEGHAEFYRECAAIIFPESSE